MNILIFAGGQGTRLWPASRKSQPKQLLKLVGKDTLLQQTYKRMRKGFNPAQIFIATASDYADQIQQQLPGIKNTRLSLEPMRKDRGPALGLAALIMQHHSNDDIFATAWSDDHIKQDDIYHQTLKNAEKFLKENPNTIVAVGIKPTTPSKAFRYLKTGKELSNAIHYVKQFTDKPTDKLAEKYFKSGQYLINSGYFISSANHILNLYQEHQPEAYKLLTVIRPAIGTKNQNKAIEKHYSKMPSFDFEELFIKDPSRILVTPGLFDWADVGRWSVIKDIQSELNDNLTEGLIISHETTGSLIYNYNPKQIVSTLHVNNLIIVVTPEAVLVADKNKSEELKHLIEKLKSSSKLKKFL